MTRPCTCCCACPARAQAAGHHQDPPDRRAPSAVHMALLDVASTDRAESSPYPPVCLIVCTAENLILCLSQPISSSRALNVVH